MSLEPRDYVALGTDRLPDGSRKPNALAYLSVYLQAFTTKETVALQVLNAFLEWNRVAPRYSFVLDLLGKILGQPRPSGFGDEDYVSVLVARTIARSSKARDDDIVKLVAYLATLNGGVGRYSVSGGPPEHWNISIFDVALTPQWETLYARLIYDAIGATDSFTLSTPTSATALYDDESTLYDVGLYGP